MYWNFQHQIIATEIDNQVFPRIVYAANRQTNTKITEKSTLIFTPIVKKNFLLILAMQHLHKLQCRGVVNTNFQPKSLNTKKYNKAWVFNNSQLVAMKQLNRKLWSIGRFTTNFQPISWSMNFLQTLPWSK